MKQWMAAVALAFEACLLCTGATSQAEVITFSYEGVVTDVHDDAHKLDGSVVDGMPFTVTISFNTTPQLADVDPGGYALYYYDLEAPGGLTMLATVGNYTFRTGKPPGRDGITIYDDGFRDSFGVDGRVIGTDFSGKLEMRLSLYTSTNLSAITSLSLPRNAPDPDVFESSDFLIWCDSCDEEDNVFIHGTVGMPVELYVVPAVVGKPLAAAQSAIWSAGLGVGIGYVPDSAPYGQVIAVEPESGTVLWPDASVFMTVSSGPPGGLAAHWMLDEMTGTVAVDSSANKCNGTLYGGPLWQPTTGQIGGALQFDGVDDYVDCGNPAALNIQEQVTLACWIKVDAFTKEYETILAKGDNAYRLSRSRTRNTLHMGLSGTSAGSFNGVTPVADNNWHHVAGTYDGSDATLYVDGVVDVTAPATGYISSNSYNLFIGDNSQMRGRYFKGLMDDVRVYGRALSPCEINGIMLSDPDSCLVGYWKLDETAGAVAADSSGNGNDGYPTGGPLWQPGAGKMGGALQFDGIDDCVALASTGGPTDTFTFGAWIKTSATHEIDEQSTASCEGVSGQRYAFGPPHPAQGADVYAGAGLSVGTNGISVYEHGSNYMPATAVYSGEIGRDWNHVMVVYDNKRPTIYLNGRAVCTGSRSPRGIVYAPDRFGGMPYGYLAGLMDEVRIYASALTEREVQGAMRGPVPRRAIGNIVWVSDSHHTFPRATSPDDQGWVDLLRSVGYQVDHQPPASTGAGYWQTLDAAKLADLEAADLIIVSRAASSADHATDPGEIAQWNSLETPLLLLQAYLAQNNRWLWIDSTDIGARQAYYTAEAIDPLHPVFEGVPLANDGQVVWLESAVVPGFSSCMNVTSVGNGHVIAARPDNNYVLIAEWAPGVPFYDGSSQMPGDKRMLFSAGTQETADTGIGWGVYNLTPEGQTMFLNAVAYMIGTPIRSRLPQQMGVWTFDEGSGTVAMDSSGNGNNGRLVGGPTWVPGRFGKGLKFDGVDDYVEIPHNVSLLPIGNEETVSAWINAERHSGPNNELFQAIISKGDSPRLYSLYMYNGGKNLHFSTGPSGAYDNTVSTTQVPLNRWVHVALVVQDGQHRYYIDGEAAGVFGSGITLPTGSTSVLLIGESPGERPTRAFQGMIDDVRLYDFAMSEEEIKGLFNGNPPTLP